MNNVVDVAFGGSHTAVVDSCGGLWVAGTNLDGQLGAGTFETVDGFVRVPLPADAVTVSCGSEHTAVVDAVGRLWVSGSNIMNQLGSTSLTSTPVFVATDVVDAAAVSCGSYTTAVVTSSSVLRVAGTNDFAQLGVGRARDVFDYVVPPAVEGVLAVSAAPTHTAVVDLNGQVWSAGANRHGELSQPAAKSWTFAPADAPFQAVSVACGSHNSAAIDVDGRLWLCGSNENGQLGHGTSRDTRQFRRADFGVAFVSVSFGSQHLAAVDVTGRVWMAGSNRSGQFGLVTPAEKMFSLAAVEFPAHAVSVAAGAYNTAVVDIDGSLWFAGSNRARQLGFVSDHQHDWFKVPDPSLHLPFQRLVDAGMSAGDASDTARQLAVDPR